MSTADAMAKAVQIVGSQVRLAAAISRSQGWISDVVKGRRTMIPVDIAFSIERATGGVVKAEEFAGLGVFGGNAEAPAPETEADAGAGCTVGETAFEAAGAVESAAGAPRPAAGCRSEDAA